jgi:hypothetical protein
MFQPWPTWKFHNVDWNFIEWLINLKKLQALYINTNWNQGVGMFKHCREARVASPQRWTPGRGGRLGCIRYTCARWYRGRISLFNGQINRSNGCPAREGKKLLKANSWNALVARLKTLGRNSTARFMLAKWAQVSWFWLVHVCTRIIRGRLALLPWVALSS